jgi:hypothetical protein
MKKINSRKISLEDGKYEVILNPDPNNWEFKATRYNEEWRNLAGDKLVLSMFQSIIDLFDEIEKLKENSVPIPKDIFKEYKMTKEEYKNRMKIVNTSIRIDTYV